MNRTASALSALALGFSTMTFAQAAGPQAPAAAAQAPVKPEAIPAKIALIAFQEVVVQTNEGQQAVVAVQKKYEPTKAKIDAAGAEVENLKKQLQAATTITEEERASRIRTIDAKEKQLNLDAETATNSYNQDIQEAFAKVAQKVNGTLRDYVTKNGYTLLLDISGQQSPVMWALPQTDISQAVVDAYNASSGVAAPPPSAPSAGRPAAPRRSTAPKAAPKP